MVHTSSDGQSHNAVTVTEGTGAQSGGTNFTYVDLVSSAPVLAVVIGLCHKEQHTTLNNNRNSNYATSNKLRSEAKCSIWYDKRCSNKLYILQFSCYKV